MLLQRFFQFITAVVRAQGEVDRRHGFRDVRDRQNFMLFHKFQQRGDPLLDLIAAILIDFVGAADRVADVFFKFFERFVKFAQQKGFVRRLRIQ